MIDSYYLFMMDTLIRNNQPMKGAVELLDTLNIRRMPFVILTEQSGKTRDSLAERMNQAGFHDIRSLDIYSSCMAAVDWIRWMYPQKNKAVMIGGSGMKDALQKGGLEINHVTPDWLFLGMNANLTYIDYCDALQVLDEGAQLIITDGRKTMIKENARMIGNESVAKMLEYASGKEGISFGRGSDRLIKQGMKYYDVPSENITMVGTHFQKDILPAAALGMTTVYVTQGNSIVDLGMNDECHPDYIVEDLSGLAK
jgi:Predicted sugar phosphatases of the HAD superfamily